MNKYYRQGIAAKGHDGHEDGDSLLWACLLLAVGDSSQISPILECQDEQGQMFRSPRLKDEGPARNSFSRDMATGFTLAAASSERVWPAYKLWIEYILANECEACEVHDGRCIMTPGIFFWAHYLGIFVPWWYRYTAYLNRLYLSLACYVNPTGYQLHLAGVSLLIQKKLGQWGWLEQKGALRLAKRQPKNPFFQWLAGNNSEARFLLDEVKMYISFDGQGRMHQWAWERDDKERAWQDSCGHDIEFMEMLLNG